MTVFVLLGSLIFTENTVSYSSDQGESYRVDVSVKGRRQQKVRR